LDALNEAFVARFMALRFSTDVTPYQGIHGVPTATCVSFSAQGAETRRRFWRLEPGIIRYRDKRQYEEHLRALWMEAIGARLRAEGTVWAELSGGLDSSSVVCMADALIKAGRVAATGIQPLSHVTLHSPEGDERPFIAEVEAKVGIQSCVLGVEEHEETWEHEWDWVTPFVSYGVALAARRYVRERGGRLILSGRAGDTVMGCAPDNSVAVFDDLTEGHLVRTLVKMRQWSRACRKPFVEIARELARQAAHAWPPALRPSALNDAQRAGAMLLTQTLQTLLCDVPAGEANRLSGRWSQRGLIESVWGYSLEGRLSPRSELRGITYTYPFAHRPLIDFVLAIPGEELSAPGEMRSLMRRAFDGLVPARVLRRTSKGYYPPAAMRAARKVAATMRPVERLEVVRRGWIDSERLDTAVSTLIDGNGSTGAEVRKVMCLEQWLSSRYRRGPAETPQRKEVISHAVLEA
ncbi:MAG: asparagine synthase-related protein, partial [Vicinamibacteraceae bacterium]